MKNRKNSPISFGITLASANRTGEANTDLEKKSSSVCCGNAIPPPKKEQAAEVFDFPRMELPPGKPFTPDMFTCGSMTRRTFPPPKKMSREEERVHRELERLRSRTVSYPSSKKSSSMAAAAAWGFFKVVFAGVFLAFKYIFIAVSVIITIGCMLCAGRQTGGLK